MKLNLILGNQLFPSSYYKNAELVFMCEDINLCTHYKYHKHKIIFFLASMRNYAEELKDLGKEVHYFKLDKKPHFFIKLEELVKSKKVKEIEVSEIEDKFFETEIKNFCKKNKLKLSITKSAMFLVTRDGFKSYNQAVKKPFMKTFYEKLRQETGILMSEGRPEGGKYSFDTENRKKIPKKHDILKTPIVSKHDKNTEEVKKLVEILFPDHPGSVDNFWMHTTRKGALKELNFFLKEKFELFGIYEDAIDQREPFLYHSVLSPYMNAGLITPKEVITKALKTDVALNSKEGFIRQIIGWREFIRGVYQQYSEKQESSNFFNHKRALTKDWYEGTTGILPLDDAILKANNFGYNHHIERLMILSNIMLLCEITPQEVHRWFMEMYVDSSDWVMGPNVYGMAQFSDGGIFATKPYIAGSNYIKKMGHYKKGDWEDTLDGLYWRFIDKNKEFFAKNYRMSMMVKLLEKMDADRKKKIFKAAQKFLKEKTNLCPR